MAKASNFKIHRIKKDGNYTFVDNALLRDTRLSIKARGLMACIISLPDSWDFSVAGLCVVLGEGQISVRNGLKELAAHGYLSVTRQREANGRMGRMMYEFFETPGGSPESRRGERPRSAINKDDILELVTDVMQGAKPSYRINGQIIEKSRVQEVLRRLDDGHITQIVETLRCRDIKAKNIQGYLLSCLYNAAVGGMRRGKSSVISKAKTRFANYTARKWNYEYLEMMEKAKVFEDLGRVEEAAHWRKRAEEVKVAGAVA